jgi:hypothetical protein
MSRMRLSNLFDAQQDTLALDGFSAFEVEELMNLARRNTACRSSFICSAGADFRMFAYLQFRRIVSLPF